MIRLATLEDVPPLVDVLARAFVDDPFVSWLVRSDEKRSAGFARFFEMTLRTLTIPHGHVYTNDELTGAACWTPPGKWKMGLAREIGLIGSFAKICGWSRLLKLQLASSGMMAAHPKQPHYYLMVLGVDPSAQGRGIGRQLLAPILEQCDREQMPAYLETGTERNLPLYQSLGFQITGEVQIKNGPVMWLMWRA